MSDTLFSGYTTKDDKTNKYSVIAPDIIGSTHDTGHNYPCSCCGMTYQKGGSVKAIRGAKRGIRLLLNRPDGTDKIVEYKYHKTVHKQVKTRNGTHLVVVKVANG